MQSFQDVMKTRRSTRKYQKRSVPKEYIDQMIEASLYAPSWKNSQVTRYYVALNEDMVKKVKGALPEFNQKNVADAPVLIVSAIVLGQSGFGNDGNPANELGNGWGYYDCGLQDMILQLKATELGLSTLVMGIRDEKALREIFHIDAKQSIVSVIAVGYADIDPQMPKRKTVEDIAQYD